MRVYRFGPFISRRSNAILIDVQERRRFVRHAAKLRLLFQRDGVTHFLEAESRDLSLGGIFVQTKRRPLPTGSKVSVLLPVGEEELLLSGVVKWISDDVLADNDFSDTEDTRRGMGIEFDELDATTREKLAAVVEQLAQNE